MLTYVQVVVQPRARVSLPLLFFRGNLRAGASAQVPVGIRVRRACIGSNGRETFEGAVIVEDTLVVCGTVRAPICRHHVRLFVRNFASDFAGGKAVVLRRHLRFPYPNTTASDAQSADHPQDHPQTSPPPPPPHLEEIWMTVRTAGGGSFVGRRGGSKASHVPTAPAAVGGGALRSAKKEQVGGRTVAGGGGGRGGAGGGRGVDDGEGNAVVVDAEVMRCAGSGRYALTYADVC
jgi:hypothetical protein